MYAPINGNEVMNRRKKSLDYACSVPNNQSKHPCDAVFRLGRANAVPIWRKAFSWPMLMSVQNISYIPLRSYLLCYLSHFHSAVSQDDFVNLLYDFYRSHLNRAPTAWFIICVRPILNLVTQRLTILFDKEESPNVISSSF